MSTDHDDIFKAMADPSRRQILSCLCRQSHEAGELARMVGLAPNALSFHLRALKAADLVTVRRDGRFLRYSLDDRGLSTWRSHVDRLFPADTAPPQFERPERVSPPVAAGDANESFNANQLPTELL